MPSDIFWLAALELPDDTVSAFIDTDRLRTEDAIDRFTKLNPAIRPALFKLKYVGGKLLVKKVIGRSGLRKPREVALQTIDRKTGPLPAVAVEAPATPPSA